MTSYEFGDIVLVPFPFTDQSSFKKRPAVVVSSPAYNRDRPDIIILAVTSQMAAPPQIGSFLIKDWQAAGLLMPSVAKPIVTTLQKSLVTQKLGRLVIPDLESLKKALQEIFG